MRLLLVLSVLYFVFSVSGAEAADPAWPIYWVKQTKSSPAVLNTIPNEKVFSGATPESVAQFNISASNNDSPPCKVSEGYFFARIKAHAATGKPMIVFLHGCCSGENASMEKARRLASNCSMPVIMFRWPAFGSLVDYDANENVLNRGKGRILRFLDELETVLPANQTVLVGHSMGTRVLVEALDRRSETLKALLKAPYKLSVLAAADTEAEPFCQEIGAIARASTKTVVLINKSDKALFCSSQLHQKFPRLGDFGEVSFDDSKDHAFQILDVSELPLGATSHDMPIELIGTMVKRLYAPYGFVCSNYYITKVKNNLWQVSTRAPISKPRFDLRRVTVTSDLSAQKNDAKSRPKFDPKRIIVQPLSQSK